MKRATSAATSAPAKCSTSFRQRLIAEVVAPGPSVRRHQFVEREPNFRIAPAEELAQPPARRRRMAVQEPRFGG
jgi:hypothetical protein